MVHLMFSSPARLGLLHADPHPGNFLMLADGRIGVIDYGAVAVLPDGLPPVLGRILRYAADREADLMMTLLRDERFVTGDVPAEDVMRWLGSMADPLRVDEFHADRAWIAKQGARVANVQSNAYRQTGRVAEPARRAHAGCPGLRRLDEHPGPDRLHGARPRGRLGMGAQLRRPVALTSATGRASSANELEGQTSLEHRVPRGHGRHDPDDRYLVPARCHRTGAHPGCPARPSFWPTTRATGIRSRSAWPRVRGARSAHSPNRACGRTQVVGKILDGMGQIPIKRGTGDAGALDDAIEQARAGTCIGVFPEGTRSEGRKLRARSGAGFLVKAVPETTIVLARVRGTTDIVRFPKRPHVQVDFFPPAGGQLQEGESAARLMTRLMAEIRADVPPEIPGRSKTAAKFRARNEAEPARK